MKRLAILIVLLVVAHRSFGCFPTVTIAASPNDTVCSGTSVTYVATMVAGGTATTYQWYVNGNAVSGTGSTMTYLPANLDSIRCVVTTSGGVCTSSVSVSSNTVYMVVHQPPPSPLISGPPGVCIGASVDLSATNPGGTWASSNVSIATVNTASGIAQSLAVGSAVITYTIGPDVNGCTAYDTFTLNVITSSYTMTGTVTDVACYGDSSGSILLITDPIAGTYTYGWSYGGTAATATALPAGSYSVLVTDTVTKCKRSATYAVHQPDSLHAEIVTERRVCNVGGFLRADVTGGTSPYSYKWEGWQDTLVGWEVTPQWGGVYTLTVSDTNGCTRQLWDNFIDVPCNTVIVGEGFSPNGDGFNDTWTVFGLDEYPKSTVYVFDKWGDVLFEKTGYRSDWYGTKGDGGHLPDGVYYYLVKLNEPSKTGGDNVFKGLVMIKR